VEERGGGGAMEEVELERGGGKRKEAERTTNLTRYLRDDLTDNRRYKWRSGCR